MLHVGKAAHAISKKGKGVRAVRFQKDLIRDEGKPKHLGRAV